MIDPKSPNIPATHIDNTTIKVVDHIKIVEKTTEEKVIVSKRG
jgi:hypothetical protein